MPTVNEAPSTERLVTGKDNGRRLNLTFSLWTENVWQKCLHPGIQNWQKASSSDFAVAIHLSKNEITISGTQGDT